MINRLIPSLALLDRSHRRRLVASLALSLLLAALETLSLALLYSLVQIASQDGQPSGRVVRIGQHLGLHTKDQLVTALSISLGVVYIGKAIFGLSLRKWTIKVLLAADSAVQARLFASYLRAPLSFHLRHNSAFFVRNLTQTMQDAVGRGLNIVSLLVADLLLLVAVFATALVLQPLVALLASVYFLALGLLIYKVIRPRYVEASGRFMRGAAASLNVTNQAFGAIREIVVADKGASFSRLLESGRDEIVQSRSTTMLFAEVPRYVLEVGIVVGAAPLLIVIQGASSGSSSAAIALFAAVAFRALPTVSRVLANFGDGLFSRVAAHSIMEAEQEANSAIAADRAEGAGYEHGTVDFVDRIELDSVSFRYSGSDQADIILCGVDLTIRAGEYIGITGESGSGKSTMLDLIVGLQRPTEGVVRVDGKDIRRLGPEWRKLVGYVPQHTYILDRSVLENVAFGELIEDGIDEGRVWRALESANLDDVVRSLPDGVRTPLGERGTRLSGGQQQRIGIARALFREPRLLVLDEATSALDTETEREILQAVDRLAGTITIVAVTHRIASLTHCDRVLLVEGGAVAEIRRSDDGTRLLHPPE